MPPVALFLLQALIVIGLPYGLWRLRVVRAWAPLVVVQIVVGVALGPTVLGRVAPDLGTLLFPPGSLAAMDGLVWLALVFFGFATGLHFDLAEFRGRGRAFAAVSVATVVAPTAAGVLLGLGMAAVLPQAMGPASGPWVFALGIGIAVGVTALPVLAAVLRDMHRLKTPLGAEALGCAAVNDAALWAMMAALLAVHGGGSAARVAAIVIGGGLAVALLWCCVRPGLARLFAHAEFHGRVNERDVVVLSAGLLLAALVTEAIGLHAVVGAFAFGAVVPKAVARDLLGRFESFLTVVLLPFFFIATGLKTEITLGTGALTVFALALPVSVATKLLAAALPARAFGRPWPEALALGALVGCKGLMELVVLTILLEAGIVSAAGFGGLVLMALAATALARPLAEAFLNSKAAIEAAAKGPEAPPGEG